MPQAHFIEARTPDGFIHLVRADAITWVEPYSQNGEIAGYHLHTPAGTVLAMGMTRDTLHEDMKSAQIVVVALNRSTAAPRPAPVVDDEETEIEEEPRSVVVRAPPPVALPDETAADAEEPAAPTKKPARKATA